VKAFYRLGCAYIGLGEYSDARIQLNKALEMEPNNGDIQFQFNEIKRLEKQDKIKMKLFNEQMRQKLKLEQQKQSN
jgi:tetratricopeptide (TPR) repeat protein